jgi:hypothetical protein
MFKNLFSGGSKIFTTFGVFKNIMLSEQSPFNAAIPSFKPGSAKVIGVTKPSVLARLLPSDLDQRPLQSQLTEWVVGFVGSKLITVLLPWAVKSSVLCLKFVPAGYRNAVAISGGLITFFSKFSQFFSPASVVASSTPIPQEVRHVIMHQVQENGLQGIPRQIRQTIDAVTANGSQPPSTLTSAPFAEGAGPIHSLAENLVQQEPGLAIGYYLGWGVVVALGLGASYLLGVHVYNDVRVAWNTFQTVVSPLGTFSGGPSNLSTTEPFSWYNLVATTIGSWFIFGGTNNNNSNSTEATPAPVQDRPLIDLEDLPDSPLLRRRSVAPRLDTDLIDLSEFADVPVPSSPLLNPVATEIDSAVTNEVAEGFRALLLQ